MRLCHVHYGILIELFKWANIWIVVNLCSFFLILLYISLISLSLYSAFWTVSASECLYLSSFPFLLLPFYAIPCVLQTYFLDITTPRLFPFSTSSPSLPASSPSLPASRTSSGPPIQITLNVLHIFNFKRQPSCYQFVISKTVTGKLRAIFRPVTTHIFTSLPWIAIVVITVRDPQMQYVRFSILSTFLVFLCCTSLA